MLTNTDLTKPADNKCTICRDDLGSGVMIFSPSWCMSCSVDEHCKVSRDNIKEKRLTEKANKFLDTIKTAGGLKTTTGC